MIRLTRLNHEPFYLNPDLIQELESAPDTVIALTTGARIIVAESPEELIDEIVAYRRRITNPPVRQDHASPYAASQAVSD
jgi:flagellar protein FlbD